VVFAANWISTPPLNYPTPNVVNVATETYVDRNSLPYCHVRVPRRPIWENRLVPWSSVPIRSHSPPLSNKPTDPPDKLVTHIKPGIK